MTFVTVSAGYRQSNDPLATRDAGSRRGHHTTLSAYESGPLTTVTYDDSDETFTVVMKVPTSPVTFTRTFGPEDIVAAESNARVTVYLDSGERFEVVKGGFSTLALEYVGTAALTSDDTLSAGAVNYFNIRSFTLIGFETPFEDMPQSGQAAYELRVVGGRITPAQTWALGGEGELTANFGTGLVFTHLDLTLTTSLGVTTPFLTLEGPARLLSGPGADASNAFTGLLIEPGDLGDTTQYSGAFYGPNAEEVGGVFSDRTPGGGVTDYMFGAFVGATDDATVSPPTLNTSLTDLDHSQIFTANAGGYLDFVAYDAATDTFTVPLRTDHSAQELLPRMGYAQVTPAMIDAAASNATRTVYSIPNANGAPQDDRIVLYTPGASPLALDYVAIGYWENVDELAILGGNSPGEPMAIYMAYGMVTPFTDVDFSPSGDATYDIDAVGLHPDTGSGARFLVGDGQIVVHLAGADFSDTTLNLRFLDNGTPWRSFSASNTGAMTTHWGLAHGLNTFLIPIEDIGDPSVTGSMTGNFFGPTGEQIGGTFSIPGQSSPPFIVPGFSPGDPTPASGAFVGERVP